MLTTTGTSHTGAQMGRIRHGMALVIALLSLSATLPAADAARATPTLSVFLYDYVGLPSSELEEATRTVQRIYREAGVELTWAFFDRDRLARAALNPDSDGTPVNDALSVQLRTQAMTDACRCRANVLGLAVPGSRLAWVLTPRVRTLAASRDHDFGALLGHVIAHEMGHLLLSPAEHTLTGLMSASLNLPDISRGRVRFSADEATRIRAGLGHGLQLARR